HRHRARRISRVEMGRAQPAAGADRAVQARALPALAERVFGLAAVVTAAPVATAYTYQFVRRHLPTNARSILEIGCGDGELAERLLQDGLRVVALDSDEACVAKAK